MQEYTHMVNTKLNDKQFKELLKLEKDMAIQRSSIMRLALNEFIEKNKKGDKNKIIKKAT